MRNKANTGSRLVVIVNVEDVLTASLTLSRSQGHTGSITDLAFIRSSTQLVSASKDTFVRVWDLSTQSCVQTLVGHRHEVWALSVHDQRLVTGSADNKLRVWIIDEDKLEYHGTVDRSTEVRWIDRDDDQHACVCGKSPSQQA